MPIYEYKCQACGHQFETIQKTSDSPLTDCTECGKNSLEKEVSVTSFQLKGSGWYVTDYKKNGSLKKEETVVAQEVSSDKKGADSSDKKPVDSKTE